MRLCFTVAALLALMCLAAFGRSVSFEFVYDDEQYILENRAIGAGVTPESLLWATTAFHSNNWHPVTWISHALDVELFGLNPGGHHLVNLLLHLLASILLFASMNALGGWLWRSFFVAALFAVHPLHAESVSWVSERKGILSAVFLGLTLLSHVRYVRRPSVRRYLPTVLLFSLGLMSKPTLVCLPLALLLLDYWPFGRFHTSRPRTPDPDAGPISRGAWLTFAEKIPLILLSSGAGALTYLAQKTGGALRPAELYPLGQRVGNAAVAVLSYLGETAFPRDLMFFYPHPASDLATWKAVSAACVILGVCVVTWVFRRRLPAVFVGWHWYLAMLLPVLGLLQVGDQARADRYTYLPLTGIFLGVVCGAAGQVGRRLRTRRSLAGAGGAVLVLCVAASFLQSATWRNALTLSGHALRIDPENWFAHQLRSVPLARQGDVDGALLHLTEALRRRPQDAIMHNNAGFLLGHIGRTEEAFGHYREAAALRPGYSDPHFNMAVLYLRMGMRQAAVAEHDILEILDPERAAKIGALLHVPEDPR